MADLRRCKRDRHIGVNARFEDFGRRRICAARQIDGHDRQAHLGDRADDFSVHPGRSAIESGTENSIDDDIRVSSVSERVIDLVDAGDVVDRNGQALTHHEVRECIAADLRAVTDDEDHRYDAAVFEMPRDRQSIAAVLSGPAEDCRAIDVGEVCVNRVDDRERGVLHEHDRRHAEALGRPPIDVPHLLRSQDLHGATASEYRSRSSAVSMSNRSGNIATLWPDSRIFSRVIVSTFSLPHSMSSSKIDESNAAARQPIR